MNLTSEQQVAYDYMCNGENVFLTGCSGVGKSEIIKKFNLDNMFKKKIGITSTTGASALLIGGTTLHSYLGIGIGKASADVLVRKILANNIFTKRWRDLNVLIIDEVSMLTQTLFEKLNEIGKVIRFSDEPFGGIQIILSGDFLQLPCIGGNFCFQSEEWDKVIDHTIYLTTIIRQENIEFQTCLNEIRMGQPSQNTKNLIETRLNLPCSGLQIKPTKICCVNRDVDAINQYNLEKLIKKNKSQLEYELIINMVASKDHMKYKKILNETIPDSIILTEKCQVMLTSNIDIKAGLVNGSRGVIMGFVDDFPLVLFKNGCERVIDFISFEITDEKNKTIGTYTYLPIKLGYAFSIHKTQGCSLDCAKINLQNLFEYGQGYVAMSRVRSLDGLYISNINWDNIRAHPLAIEFYDKL